MTLETVTRTLLYPYIVSVEIGKDHYDTFIAKIGRHATDAELYRTIRGLDMYAKAEVTHIHYDKANDMIELLCVAS